MESNKLKVSLFDGIVFEYQDNKYPLDLYLSKKLLSLIEILLLNYGTQVTSEYLINIMWQDSDNPKSSLKYHIFKLRKCLKDIPSFTKLDFIVTTKTGYEFRPIIECEVDTFILHHHYIFIQNNDLDQGNLAYAITIENVYRGYLKYDTNYLWFLQAKEYYHNIYLQTVDKLCHYLLQHHEDEKVKEMALKAVRIEPMMENHHIYYIQALINLNEYDRAYDYYQTSTKMLFDNYDISLSDRMKDLYDYLVDGMRKRNIGTITEQLKSKKVKEGAFYCESIIFDYIYDMHLRSASRTKLNYYAFVFDITPTSEIKNFTQKVKKIIQYSLRTGDVFTRVSKFQFLALLPCKDDEIGHTVAQRVTSMIRKKMKNDNVTVSYHIDTVISTDEK